MADKGLNCAQNIAFSKKNGDGYLFSKAVKVLPEKEKKWVLLEQGFKEVRDKNKRLIYRYKSCVDEFPYDVIHEGRRATIHLRKKDSLLITLTLQQRKNMRSTVW